MSSQHELFSEFMILSYEPGNKYNNLRDILIKPPYTIVRLDGQDCKIIYMHSGLSITIPWKWIDVFTSYNVKYGYRAISIKPSEENIDRLIYNFLMFITFLDNRRGDEFLNSLYNICRIGTKEFRKMSIDEFGEKFDPISFDSLDNHLTI